MEVIDNYLSDTDFKKIQNLFLHDEQVAWTFNPSCVEICEKNGPFQFTHVIYRWFMPTSHSYNSMECFMNKIKPHGLIRIKANLNTRTENIVINGFHTDHPFDHKVGIYYLNSNNGFTLFEDGTKVESVQNRMLLFDGNLRHSGTNCTDEQRRVVINFNFL